MKGLNQTKCPALRLMLFTCAIALWTGCHRSGSASPQGYRLDQPEEMQLGKVLNEISGISMKPGSQELAAISDSKEKVFGISLNKLKLKDLTDKVVAPNSDLEDLVCTDSAAYLLSSAGIIIEVKYGAQDSAEVKKYPLPLDGTNDFETLYYDPSANGLVMMCKSCEFEKGAHQRAAFLFHLDTKQFDSTAFYTINTQDVESILKDNDAKFHPSAAAVHPINKRLYILSSAGNLLVITDTRGKVIEAYHLNPDLFPQAEGIAFAPNGDMYISNEGKFGKPTLLLIRYQGGSRKNK